MTGGFPTYHDDHWIILKYSRKALLSCEIPSFLLLVHPWSHCGCLKLCFLFIHLLRSCLRGLTGEDVSLPLRKKRYCQFFNCSTLGALNLGKTWWYAVTLQLHHYVHLFCSSEWTPRCCFSASLHFKFMPKIFIEKVIWCFHTEIKPIHFYEGDVPG